MTSSSPARAETLLQLHDCPQLSAVNTQSAVGSKLNKIFTVSKKVPRENILSFVYITLSSKNIKKKFKAQIDTGNTLTSGVAISPAVQRAMKATLSGPVRQVSTAKSGQTMRSTGLSSSLNMKIDGLEHVFNIMPTVVQGLAGDVNLGTAFLSELSRQGRVSLVYDDGRSVLNIAGRSTEMIKSINIPVSHHTSLADGPGQVKKEGGKTGGRPQAAGQERRSRTAQPTPGSERRHRSPPPHLRPVVTTRNFTLKRQSVSFIPVKYNDRSDQTSAVCVEGTKLFDNSNNEVISAVYKPERNIGAIAIINLGLEDRYVAAGTNVANYTEVYNRNNVGQEGTDHEGETIQTTTDIPKMAEEDVQRILEDLRLKDKEVLKEDPKKMREAEKLVREFSEVFSNPAQTIGKTSLMEFEVKLKPGSVPVKGKTRPMNPSQVEDLQQQLDEWLREGVIVEADASSSQWASPIVPVLKKALPGQAPKTRYCIDYRQLNSCTIPDSFPLPNLEQNIESLAGSSIFSTLDSASAYNSIPVAKKSRPYLTFICALGTFMPMRMPFGAINSASCYSRFVQKALKNLDPRYVLSYLDDVITHAKDWKSHLQHLRATLQAHREAGLRLRAKKTNLFEKEVDYLGYHISENGISMVPKYRERVVNWPVPTSTKALSSFLGFTNYYRSFIPEYSFLCNEMNSAKKAEKFEWTPVMDEKFKRLKTLFDESPIRAFPRYDIKNPFELSVDFSKENLGAVLSQVQDGQERLISCAGRKTTPYERNYHSCKGELAAIIFALRRWEHVLRYRRFILHTDNSALVYIQSMKNPRGIFFRWLEEIQSYNFEIRHKKGKLNSNADGISRSEGMLPPPSPDEVGEQAEYLFKLTEYLSQFEDIVLNDGGLQDEDGIICSLNHSEFENMLELDQEGLAKAQGEDPVLMKVKEWIEKDARPTKEELRGAPEILKAYAQNLPHLYLSDGILYDKRKLGKISGQPLNRLVIPESQYQAVFNWSHKHPTAAHPGEKGTYYRAICRFYWPGITSYLKTQTALCDTCLAKKTTPGKKNTVHKPVKRGFVNEILYIDLVGPLSPPSPEGFKYILSMEDGFSRFVGLTGLKSKEGGEVAKKLYDEWVCKYGTPSSIHSDNGTEMVNTVMKQLADKFKIKLTNTPVYNPQSNIVERFHRDLNKMMRTFLDREDIEWSRYLANAALAHNTAVHSSTGVTPFFAFFGRECRLPVDIIIPSPDLVPSTLNDHVKSTLLNFNKTFKYVRENERKIIRRNEKLYTGETGKYQQGSSVWYLSPLLAKSGKTRKITNQWTGPYLVTRKISDVLFEIKPKFSDGNTITAHANRLALCQSEGQIRGDTSGDLLGDTWADPEVAEIPPPDLVRPPLPVLVPQEYQEMSDLTRRGPGRPPRRPPQAGPEQEGGAGDDERVEPNFRTPPPAPSPPNMRDVGGAEGGVETPEEVDMDPAPATPPPQQSPLTPGPSQWRDRAREEMSPSPTLPGGAAAASPSPVRPARSPDQEGGRTEPQPAPRQSARLQPARLLVGPHGGARPKTSTKLSVQFNRDGEGSVIQDKQKRRIIVQPKTIIAGRGRKTIKLKTKQEKRARHQLSPEAEDPSRRTKKKIPKSWYPDSSESEDIAAVTEEEETAVSPTLLEVKVEKGSLIPEKGTALSAAYDLRASKNTLIPAGQTVRVPLQLKLALPQGHFMLLLSRSGLAAKNGLFCQGGVIDGDYRSELCAIIYNSSREDFLVKRGQRITQAVLLPTYNVSWKEVDNLPSPEDSHLGWGSTGL